jgi:hypothetical protein
MKSRKTARAWELPDSAVLPESQYLRLREFLRLVGYGVGASVVLPVTMRATSAGFPDSLNPSFKLDGVKLTLEDSITSYNNFYEWGSAKEQPKELSNKGWKTELRSIEICGLCTNPRKTDVNDLTQTCRWDRATQLLSSLCGSVVDGSTVLGKSSRQLPGSALDHCQHSPMQQPRADENRRCFHPA